ncbi:uncharacterized protein CPUR_02881 [Claviceps purpurea 20.1]|uniref:EKC/KEOPS complex subunit BUD32 n=1 Tax=Claviceps purpurea (strain 20.1) TaxID=1111077 RepID=M1WD04_CLAP2|nr:uncharacterized protein CPUR_02881 [Claviceps purpurea 20.1]
MALILNPQNESIFLRQRIQDLERQIQERDRELQQERERALQKEKEKRKILELDEQKVRIFEQSQERQQKNQHTKRRNEKRQRRDQQREQRAAKRERALQQERDQALEQAEKTARLAREKEVALQQERDRALQQAKEREITLQQAREREMTLQLERDMALEQAQDRDRQAQERERALQYERDRALQHAQERERTLRQAQERDRALRRTEERDRALRRTEERDRALRLAQARDRGLELKMEGALRIERVKAQCREEALQRERDRALQQAQEREKALQQERDRALQQAQDGQRQAEERARALKKQIARASQLQCERDRALQLVRKYDPALQYSTLNEYVNECHDSLFSKLTIDPNAGRSGDVSTTKIRGKWQPEKLLEWTDFLSEQRVMFDLVCDVIPPELREFPRLTTVRDDGTKIVPIADEKTLERFVEESIENPVKHIMIGLQSADKLGRVCKGEVRVDFINHAEHTKPLKTETTSPQPGEPVSTRFCICRDPSVAMASSTLLYVWEHRAPYDLTIQHLRSALWPTTSFGEVTEELESTAADDVEEVSQSPAMAEERVKHAVTQTYHNMMESCLEFGILTTGQAIVFLHVNWDDPQTLYYHIAEPALDVAKAPKRDAAFLSAVGQYVAFTIMALTKSRKPLQERRIRVFKTLSKWGMPSRLLSSEPRNAASSATAKSLQNGGENRDNAQDQPYSYCSQKCLLGLVQGGSLDLECPNVRHHCRSDADEAGAGLPKRHPVDHTEWLRLLQDQFKQSLDEAITYQSIVGARGALFKVTLLAYGYTFVSKGTVAGHIKHLEHETRTYERLKPIQGRYVPVFLGTIDLRTVDKDYWIYFETYVVHMIFMSWGGFLLDEDKMYQLEVLDDVAWVDEGIEAIDAVHEAGVLHRDVRWANILYNPHTNGIMLIDFERAELFNEPEPSGEESHKEESMPMTAEQSQIWKKIVDRARDENNALEFIIVDALELRN